MSDELMHVNYEDIKSLIYTIRGKQVMLDSDVAMLFESQTKNINKAVKRNVKRFPEDFCFQLTEEEMERLRFQIGTSNKKPNSKNNFRGGRQYLPYVFTEHGISTLPGVLQSDIAIQVSINIIRAFVEMRRFFLSNASILERLTTVEYKLLEQDKRLR